jgi:metal-dependent hydrolase (beta-lactamase superfamily II)
VLSHFHFDHTGGLEEIVNLLRRKGITQSINVYVAKGFFEPRYLDQRSAAGRSLAERLGSSQ